MSSGFLTLKRDIVEFVEELDQWIKDQGTALENEAKQLQLDIDNLTQEISEYVSFCTYCYPRISRITHCLVLMARFLAFLFHGEIP
jgi:SMC interacting uncharacterized protein involved in chromosome segregation